MPRAEVAADVGVLFGAQVRTGGGKLLPRPVEQPRHEVIDAGLFLGGVSVDVARPFPVKLGESQASDRIDAGGLPVRVLHQQCPPERLQRALLGAQHDGDHGGGDGGSVVIRAQAGLERITALCALEKERVLDDDVTQCRSAPKFLHQERVVICGECPVSKLHILEPVVGDSLRGVRMAEAVEQELALRLGQQDPALHGELVVLHSQHGDVREGEIIQSIGVSALGVGPDDDPPGFTGTAEALAELALDGCHGVHSEPSVRWRR